MSISTLRMSPEMRSLTRCDSSSSYRIDTLRAQEVANEICTHSGRLTDDVFASEKVSSHRHSIHTVSLEYSCCIRGGHFNRCYISTHVIGLHNYIRTSKAIQYTCKYSSSEGPLGCGDHYRPFREHHF